MSKSRPVAVVSDIEDDSDDIFGQRKRKQKKRRRDDAPVALDEKAPLVRLLLTGTSKPLTRPTTSGAFSRRQGNVRPDFNTEPPQPDQDVLHDGRILIPAATARWLRPYQVDGVAYLWQLYASRTGGLLGDDMGLGKTVQVITFLNAVFGKTGVEEHDKPLMRDRRSAGRAHPRVLIVCPSTLLYNWEAELERWSWTHHCIYHGANKHEELEAARQGYKEVCLTTYQTYTNDADRINMITWDVVIADECHAIRNPAAQVTAAMQRINSKCRVGLTGTAIQNDLGEFWTLLNWCRPGSMLSKRDWDRAVAGPIKNGQKHDATQGEVLLGREKARELHKAVAGRLMLRRTKQLIAHELPKKIDRIVFCGLTPRQVEAYDNLMLHDEVVALKSLAQTSPKTAEQQQQLRDWLFKWITILRMLSNHLALIHPNASRTTNSAKLAEACDRIRWALPGEGDAWCNGQLMKYGRDADNCGKWKVLQQLLRLWKREGCKVLIFSGSLKLLEFLGDLMLDENYISVKLTGDQGRAERQEALDEFNNHPECFVFLISVKAGGVGLNITAANRVVIFDPSWNPAHDLQAQDRAYRIGQTRDVEVFRLIGQGTMEEVVYARQVYKQQQANIGYNASKERRYFDGVQGDRGQQGELFGITNLLTFHGQNHVLKRILQGTNIAERQYHQLQVAELHTDAAEAAPGQKSEDGFDDGVSDFIEDSLRGADGLKKRTDGADGVNAILSNLGVQYTHRNDDILGGSRVEELISSRARDAKGDPVKLARRAFDTVATQRPPPKEAHGETSPAPVSVHDAVLIGKTPLDVRERQLVSMCRWSSTVGALGLSESPSTHLPTLAQLQQHGEGADVVDFAMQLKRMRVKDKAHLLDRFYAWRRQLLLMQAESSKQQADRQQRGRSSKETSTATVAASAGARKELHKDGRTAATGAVAPSGAGDIVDSASEDEEL